MLTVIFLICYINIPTSDGDTIFKHLMTSVDLSVKVLVGTYNKEKALVDSFSEHCMWLSMYNDVRTGDTCVSVPV